MRIEEVILRNLVQNEDYTRKVVPFLSNEYFHDSQERILFEEIAKHIVKYNGLPTQETLLISLDALDTITEDQFDEISKLVSNIEGSDDKTDDVWLLDETEKFCQDKALYNAIMKSINIIDDKKTTDAKHNPISTLTIEVLTPPAMSTLNRCWRIILIILKNLFLSLSCAL